MIVAKTFQIQLVSLTTPELSTRLGTNISPTPLNRIVNKNDVIDKVPEIVKKDIQDISTDYRIYYSEYTPIVYCKVVGDYVEYTLRYLVDPRKARYVNSSIWKHILLAHQKGELKLYNKCVEYVDDAVDKKTKNKK